MFDCLEQQLKTNPNAEMFGAKSHDPADPTIQKWQTLSVEEVVTAVDELATGLLKLGVSANDGTAEGRDKVAIISKNRPEWLITDLAVQKIAAILTPIYPTINLNELEFILKDSKVRIVFVNDASLVEKVENLRSRIPWHVEIYTFEKVQGTKHWSELRSPLTDTEPAAVNRIAATVAYEDLATIIYTSGTTGTPKGVMLSHRNIMSNVIACMPCFPPGENMKALSFLPLNHIFERMVSYVYLFKGTVIYYAESLETIGDNLKEVKPQMFTTVPRLLEKVYDKIMAKGSALTGIKKKLFFWAHGLAAEYEINKNQGFWYRTQLALANKLIFSKWREALGNQLKCIITGGAACQVRLIRIFTAAQIIIMEGYGLTETSPVISVNRYEEEGRMFGTVGPLIEGVDVKIAADGEILTRGPNVMMGYYKRPDLTSETFTDDWYMTGDIGMIVDNKFLKITDRKKEMFKTSGGKYVAPLPIENKLKESKFIENIMVIGAERKYVGALIIPSFPNLKEWCTSEGIQFTTEEQMIRNEKVIKLFKGLVESYNKYFNQVEQIKKFELLPHDWTVESGEMTPKLSLKRKVITEKYREAVDRIYDN
jgi:long-chain acyl-CoA synthetase